MKFHSMPFAERNCCASWFFDHDCMVSSLNEEALSQVKLPGDPYHDETSEWLRNEKVLTSGSNSRWISLLAAQVNIAPYAFAVVSGTPELPLRRSCPDKSKPIWLNDLVWTIFWTEDLQPQNSETTGCWPFARNASSGCNFHLFARSRDPELLSNVGHWVGDKAVVQTMVFSNDQFC